MAISSALQRVVTVANGKGGVGKSSTACNVAGLAALAQWKVLLIDLDPQGSAGRLLGYRMTGQSDGGAHLVSAVIGSGTPLAPPLTGVREGLDVVPGGEKLDELEDLLTGRVRRGQAAYGALADALEPVAGDYDLIVIDTPPTRPTLLRLALAASRWLVVPTRPGRMSIDGIENLARDMTAARTVNPALELLGVVLYDVEITATAIRRNALDDVESVLGGAAHAFTSVIRHALLPAVESEERGLLIHEIAEQVDQAEPFWKALQEGRKPVRVPGSAPALAEDFVLLTQEILTAIDSRETAEGASA